MNIYLTALIGLVVMFVTGAVFYMIIGQDVVKGIKVPRSGQSLAIALVTMYCTSLFFALIYRSTSFESMDEGWLKGTLMGVGVGLFFVTIPAYVDRHYYETKPGVLALILTTWTTTFALLGAVVALLS